jgi:hypothetical protein
MSNYFNKNKVLLMVCNTVYHTFDQAFPTYWKIFTSKCCENTIMTTDKNIKVQNGVDSTAT